MLGVYDYTVILTYLSAASAGAGTIFTLTGNGHPYAGALFLVFCGLCDAFDGKVARTKKNRTEYEKKFGIQIDSLTDILAFGMLPAAIAGALTHAGETQIAGITALSIIPVFYIIAALARLAHFNVTEEERQQKEKGPREYYEGLPVTFSAIAFPTLILISFVTKKDLTAVYLIIMLIMGFLFISKLKIKKPLRYGAAVIGLLFIAEVIVLLTELL